MAKLEELKPEDVVQPVENPILSNPYAEPPAHWVYIKGVPSRMEGRRPAGYWFRTKKIGTAQQDLFAEEERDDLPLVNRLRDDVRRWRESGYRGASRVTRDLLEHWTREDRPRRLFFCQREAVETLIYLLELRVAGRSGRTGFSKFELSDEDLKRLLAGEKPAFTEATELFPSLLDQPADPDYAGLFRLGCKMATGSGKTVVMAMIVSWAFCNRGRNPASREYPNAVLICCPNLTVRERLQVLRPEEPGNYYDLFDIAPANYRELLNAGKVLITNWHIFAPKSESREGEKTYKVVQKGEETDDAFARDRLGDLFDRLPILVLNDEGHHCWRPAPAKEDLTKEEKAELEEEEEEARIWLEGLDRINNCGVLGKETRGISACIDLSATPFYIKGSGHPEGRPFPWLVSDFGLVDAIESGIVKIPRLPVEDVAGKKDDAGRPDPKYFRLWKNINDKIKPAERLQNGRPKPEAVYREAQGALLTIAGQWKERFGYVQQASTDQEKVPPVLIVVCDNTEIAQVVYEKISGEREEEVVDPDDLENEDDEDEPGKTGKKAAKKPRTRTVYGHGEVFRELANTENEKRTVRIDSKLLKEIETGESGGNRQEAAAALRQLIDTVGKRGQPGEKLRCVVSVSMLTEGWDANNVTHVLGIRAFDSQLLCEQVIGRGLRRMSYDPDPETGFLPPEYVDVYGIPFSIIPFKGRVAKQKEPDDKPRNRIFAMSDRAGYEIRFPLVEGYVYDLRDDPIVCDIASLEPLELVPSEEPTAVFLRMTKGYEDGAIPAGRGPAVPGEYIHQDRRAFYESTTLQTIIFQVTKLVVDDLLAGASVSDRRRAALRLKARHRFYPQVLRIVQEYVKRKVVRRDGVDPRELGLEKYSQLLRERVRENILPVAAAKEAPLLPVLNSFKPTLSTAGVDYTTTRPVVHVDRSHLNAIAFQGGWEKQAVAVLEDQNSNAVKFFTRNDAHVGLRIAYEYLGNMHHYEPDFIVHLRNDLQLLLEIKGYEFHDPDAVNAKNAAARKWIAAVNNLGDFGRWDFAICREVEKLAGTLNEIGGRSSGDRPAE